MLPATMPYPALTLLIDGEWLEHTTAGNRPVVNPATAETLGVLPNAGPAEIEAAARAASAVFAHGPRCRRTTGAPSSWPRPP